VSNPNAIGDALPLARQGADDFLACHRHAQAWRKGYVGAAGLDPLVEDAVNELRLRLTGGQRE